MYNALYSTRHTGEYKTQQRAEGVSLLGERGARHEEVLEGGEDVADDGHTPGFTEQALAATAAQVGHVCVMVGESKQPTSARARGLCACG